VNEPKHGSDFARLVVSKLFRRLFLFALILRDCVNLQVSSEDNAEA
jgi:hypothetical protein